MTHPFCELENYQYSQATGEMARVSEGNVKSDIECMIFPIFPEASIAAS
jgi:hypothetical protein